MGFWLVKIIYKSSLLLLSLFLFIHLFITNRLSIFLKRKKSRNLCNKIQNRETRITPFVFKSVIAKSNKNQIWYITVHKYAFKG